MKHRPFEAALADVKPAPVREQPWGRAPKERRSARRLPQVEPLPITTNRPIGTERIPTLDFQVVEMARYTITPEHRAFAALVRKLGLRISDVRHALGIGPIQACGLEDGAYSCDWAEAERRLRAWRRPDAPG